MSKDVFDPAVHKVVAVVAQDGHPERGAHVHVTLEELARDALEIQAPTVFDKPQPSIDLGPVLEAIGNLANRVAALEGEPQAAGQPDLGPVLKLIQALTERCAAFEKRHLSQETAMQSILQMLADHAATLGIVTSLKVFDKETVLGTLKAG